MHVLAVVLLGFGSGLVASSIVFGVVWALRRDWRAALMNVGLLTVGGLLAISGGLLLGVGGG